MRFPDSTPLAGWIAAHSEVRWPVGWAIALLLARDMRRDSLIGNRSLSHQRDEFVKRYLKIGRRHEVIVLVDVPAIGQPDRNKLSLACDPDGHVANPCRGFERTRHHGLAVVRRDRLELPHDSKRRSDGGFALDTEGERVQIEGHPVTIAP